MPYVYVTSRRVPWRACRACHPRIAISMTVNEASDLMWQSKSIKYAVERLCMSSGDVDRCGGTGEFGEGTVKTTCRTRND